jgi:hypothetical protein
MSDLAHLPLEALTLPEHDRPRMPAIAGATATHRRQGAKLAAIHRHHLIKMNRVAAVLARIAAGDDPPEALAAIILSTDMRRNLRAAGTICGEQCRVLGMHHNIEEFSMFPRLEAQGNAALASLIAQLRREHEVVHALLVRLESAAEALVVDPAPGSFDRAHVIFRQLRAVVVSHFGYEEAEIGEAIGFYLDGI